MYSNSLPLSCKVIKKKKPIFNMDLRINKEKFAQIMGSSLIKVARRVQRSIRNIIFDIFICHETKNSFFRCDSCLEFSILATLNCLERCQGSGLVACYKGVIVSPCFKQRGHVKSTIGFSLFSRWNIFSQG